MKAKKKFSTKLVWLHRNEQMPSDGNRILTFSPMYDEKDPFRIRLIDSQFYRLSVDAEWWAYVDIPV